MGWSQLTLPIDEERKKMLRIMVWTHGKKTNAIKYWPVEWTRKVSTILSLHAWSSTAGRVPPRSGFIDIVKCFIDVHCCMDSGKVPVREQLWAAILSRFRHDPTESGSGPLKLFPLGSNLPPMKKNSIKFQLPISAGKGPVKKLSKT